MREFVIFTATLIKKIKDNELIQMANALSFRLVLAMFPFLIFLLSLLGYLRVDYSYFMNTFISILPKQSEGLIQAFLNEVIYEKHISILSSSLFLTVFSASSGVYSAVKCLNKAYEIKEGLGYFKQRFVCIITVFAFVLLIFVSLIVLIFNDKLISFCLKNHILVFLMEILGSMTVYIILVLLMFALISLIYLIAVNKRLKIREVAPGSIFTMTLWLVISKLFNIYINNYSSISTIYGSIAGIFIFFYWINLISFIFLTGGQINAILIKRKEELQ